jgi:Kef-type K+ transport system membrane component KefB
MRPAMRDAGIGAAGPSGHLPASRHQAGMAVLYGVLAAVMTSVVVLAVQALPRAAPSSQPTSIRPAGGSTGGQELPPRFLLAVAVVLVTAHLAGGLLRRLGQPRVVGEIIAGILLGTSLSDISLPWSAGQVLPAPLMPSLGLLAHLGLVLFMFLIGLEFEPSLLRGRAQVAVAVSITSTLVPFALGLLLAWRLFPEFAGPGVAFLPFAIFVGGAMSVTAFPVLAWILVETGLNRTRLGLLSLTCAAVNDVTAWCLLALAVSFVQSQGPGDTVRTVLLTLAFAWLLLYAVRSLLDRAAVARVVRSAPDASLLVAVLAGVLVAALLTDAIGVHAILGAFLFGVALSKARVELGRVAERLRDLTLAFLLPLFFVYTGTRIRLALSELDGGFFLLLLLVLATAVLAKWTASAITARTMGMSWAESLSLGVLINCRGLTELVFLNVGLDLGLISSRLFSVMVLMAILTTLMTTPALRALRRLGNAKRDPTWPR